ncbi:MAG: hypothetical protein GY814_12845 [Gammaproteobacteria bacterium]|nr:hypothetical protein [Gammaproteobacteria bacterium]
MQIHIDARVLLVMGFIFPAMVCADQALKSVPVVGDISVLSAPKQREIDRLQHDLALRRAEAMVINERNVELYSRIKDLKSRILELSKQVMDQNQLKDDPATR